MVSDEVQMAAMVHDGVGVDGGGGGWPQSAPAKRRMRILMGLARGTPGWINRARVSRCLMAGTGGRVGVGGARERWGGREAENDERLQGGTCRDLSVA